MSVSNKKVLSNLIWRYAERSLAVLITFVVSMVLSRILSPSDYGTVALISVIIGMLEVFCTRGYNQALVQKKIIYSIDYNTVFWTNLLIEIALYILVFLSAPLIANLYGDNELVEMVRILALKIVIAGFNSIQQAYAQRNMLFRKFFFSTLFGTFFSGVVGIIMAYAGAGAWAIVAQSLINPFVDTVVLFFTIEWKPKLEFSFLSFKEMTPFGIRMFLTGLIDSVYGNLRSFIIGMKYSASDLSFHDKGRNIPSLVINNTQTAASNVFFSALSKENTIFEVKEKMREYTRMMLFVLCPVMIGIACVSQKLIIILFSAKWEPSSPYVVLYCLAYLTWIPQMLINLSLMAIQREKIVLVISMIHRFSEIAILFGILNHGPFVIALSALVMDYMVFIIAYIVANKVLKYSFLEIVFDIWRTLVSTVIMAISIILENVLFTYNNIIMSLLLNVITGVIVFVVVSIIIKNKELLRLFALIKKQSINPL